MQNTTPVKVSQRVQLPADFLKTAESDAKRVGLSLPTLLGLSARRAWQATVDSFIGEPMAPETAASLLGRTRPAPANLRRNGGAK